MGRVIAFLIGMAVGMLELAAGYNYHVVRTEDRWLIVGRVYPGLADAYADVRNWSLSDWKQHPLLAHHMLKAGHGELLQQQATDSAVDLLTNGVRRRIGSRDEYEEEAPPR